MRLLAYAVASMFLMSAAPAAASPGRVEFEILRNGNPDGRHLVEVTAVEGGFHASSQVDLEVRIGPLTVFNLEQTCRETWGQAGLEALECSTLKDGRRQRVVARRGPDGVNVDGAGGEELFALSAVPATWWVAPPTAAGGLINPETGRPMDVRVTRHPGERIVIGGRSIPAERVRVAGTLTLDLWYDAQGRWIGCVFTARGQRFEYRLVSPIAEAPRGIV